MSYFLPFVEVHVTDHCNHTCRWCHNYSPHAPRRNFQPGEYFEGLDILVKNDVTINSISLMGGEPFLHNDLVGFADTMLTRYGRPLVLTTNGFWLSEDNIHIFKDLWPRIFFLKISRYPSIEARLGGEDNILRLLELIRTYNPEMYLEWPDKFQFNELKFFARPRPVEVKCGNIGCLALVNRADGPCLGHCGAGAYAHLAPKDLLTPGFLASEHMFYPLRQFETAAFQEWHTRYPLDACAYCNFSQQDKRVRWKPASGMGLFNKTYEDDFEKQQCLYLALDNDQQRLSRKLDALLKRSPAHAEFANRLGVMRYNDGEADLARRLFELVLEHDPANRDAVGNLKAVAARS